MSMSKNPNAYIHVKPVLDAALENGGGVYTLLNKTAAITWRAQAHAYRRIIGETGPTIYDGLLLSIDNNRIIIKIVKIVGKFHDPDGKLIIISEKPPEPKDELLDIAKELALELDEGKDIL